MNKIVEEIKEVLQYEDLRKLKKEGKYEDIYNKYGEDKYNKILSKAMYNEIKQEKGNVKAIFWKLKQILINMLKRLGLYSMIFTISEATLTKLQIEANSIKYENEIEAYDEKINNYAEKIKSMNLTDIQIFMKVIDDMWESIQGYAEPEKDIIGFLELDLATEDGYGVCRNMASDIARKLNEINPEYNARTITVKMGEDGYYQINEESLEKKVSDVVQDLFGNHMVTLVDIPNDNLILVLDPTNSEIGIYKNGKIIMFNTKEECEYDVKGYMDAIFMKGGFDGVIDVSADYIQSFRESKLSFEQIEEKYGIEAQDKALMEVKTRNIAERLLNENKKGFKERNVINPSELLIPIIDVNKDKQEITEEIDENNIEK